jgi:hypothetical protein
MTKKWIAINLLLLLFAGLLGLLLKSSVSRFKQDNSLKKIRPARQANLKIVDLTPQTVKPLNVAEFSAIPEKNIFTESRSKEEVQAAPVEAPPPPLQNPILVGTLISGKNKIASIIDPASSGAAQGVKRRSDIQDKKIGDVIQGYTVTDITSEHMVLEFGKRQVVIRLHEGIKRADGGKTVTSPTRVIAIGGAGGASVGGPIMPGAIGGGGMTPATIQIGGAGGAARGQPPTASAPIPSNIIITPGGARGTFTIQTQPPTGTTGTTGSTGTTGATGATGSRGGQQNNRGNQPVRSPFGDLVRPTQ